MLAITGVVVGFLFLLLMIVLVFLLIAGGWAFYKKTGQTAAVFIIIGAVLLGLGALEAPVSVLLTWVYSAPQMAELMMIKNVISSLLHYVAYLCLGFGVYALGQHFQSQGGTAGE